MDLRGKDSEALCELLHELCSGHDWFFTMSDDSRAYHDGLANADKIQHVRGVLDTHENGVQADVLFDDYGRAGRGCTFQGQRRRRSSQGECYLLQQEHDSLHPTAV